MVQFIAPVPSMSIRAAAEIRSDIVRGGLPPGARIYQEELAAKLGISREPIRQALIMLESEGFVRNVVNRGAFVAPLDTRLINDVYEFRGAVDMYVAGKLALDKNFPASTLRDIIARGRKAVRAGALDPLIELDWTFHSELYRACGNHVLIEVMETKWGHIRRVMSTILRAAGYRRQVWDEHAAIVRAIAGGEASLAREAAVAHTQGARDWLIAGLRKEGAR